MSVKPHPLGLPVGLLVAVVLWGGSNAGTKLLVATWPPIFTGATRFLTAGLLLHALLAWTGGLHQLSHPPRQLVRDLWLRGGLSLGLYILVFNCAVKLTAVSHVALYLGAAPVWAVVWEWGWRNRGRSVRAYLAAALALAGVVVLFLPSLQGNETSVTGELLGLACSLLWVAYGRQCRHLGRSLSGAEITAHTMWRAGVLLMLPALWELRSGWPVWTVKLVGVQAYCILAGGVASYWLWNHALRFWPTSRVYLFNNLIPVSTMTWAHLALGEPLTPTLGISLVLIVTGVALGQRAATSDTHRTD